jgi:adenylate kinase family enzyme
MMAGRRIAVVGTSGSGKSVLARRIGAVLGLPVIELDAINWQPGWIGLNAHDPTLFVEEVRRAIAGDDWVCDGNYGVVRSMIMARMTDLVWLDYARSLVMARVIRRSFARALGRREIWPGTGNIERMAMWADPEHPIRWAWSTHASRKALYGTLASTLPASVRLHHLRNPDDAEELITRFRDERQQFSGQMN